MSAVYVEESEYPGEPHYPCHICGKDLYYAAQILEVSFETIKQIHENAHRLDALRTLKGICKEIVSTLGEGLRQRMEEALQILDDLS